MVYFKGFVCFQGNDNNVLTPQKTTTIHPVNDVWYLSQTASQLDSMFDCCHFRLRLSLTTRQLLSKSTHPHSFFRKSNLHIWVKELWRCQNYAVRANYMFLGTVHSAGLKFSPLCFIKHFSKHCWVCFEFLNQPEYTF